MSIKFGGRKYLIISLAFLLVGLGFWLYDIRPSGTFTVKTISETSEFYEIDAEYPAGDKVGAGKVETAVRNNIGEFKRLADEMGPEARNRGIAAPFTFNMSMETYETDEVMSYVFYMSEYTGGANVNSSVLSFNYDKDSGNEITLSDIIHEDRHEEFMSTVKEKILDRGESGIFADAIENLEMESLNHFYVTDLNTTVLFSKYEVAPGAAGIVEVTVPRS